MNNVYYAATTGAEPHRQLSDNIMQHSQAYSQQPYPNIDFYYESPHFQQQQQPTTKSAIYPSMSTSSSFLLLNTKPVMENSPKRAVDEDYVENLSNELIHTKQLLKQYQLRTEQLMELVKKQTDKINELRSQLAS